jgi:hypothetical protein
MTGYSFFIKDFVIICTSFNNKLIYFELHTIQNIQKSKQIHPTFLKNPKRLAVLGFLKKLGGQAISPTQHQYFVNQHLVLL